MVTDPTGTAPNRYVYYPGTEELSEGEVRVVACGTGMPDQRRGQASACFLFEFGNGEKFIFDIGSGSMRNLNSLMIPAEYMTKIFISHLHTDHWGDLDALWAGGWTAGRPVPLEVWGPSGQTEDMGTAYAIDGFLRAFNWDYQTRAFKITPIPGNITVHEFDYRAENAVIYDDGEIVVRSIPAIHAGDGPVSYIIEYAGLKLVFGGDTSPNKWFVEYAKDADFVIHESFASPTFFMEDYGQPAQLAWRACCEFHTSGPSFGKVMSEIEPGHAVAYHTMEEAHQELQTLIRTTYDGPLSIAMDMMTWNITKDGVSERMAVSPDRASGVRGPTRQPPPDRSIPNPTSEFIASGEWGPGFNAQNDLLDEFMTENGLEEMDWRPAKAWYEKN
ncbi:MAG: guanitoxin biosynthesis MBL fold metallo-hydrolase GntH [Methyloligellaceae bacterium]